MSQLAIAPPSRSGDRHGWLLRDTATITQRHLLHWINQPGAILIGLLFPVLVVLMFGYLFGGQMEIPGGNYREFLMPGMFAMTIVFGIETTFAAVTNDLQRGVTDRFRAMPISRAAVIAGRCAADMLYAVLSLAVMIGCGLAVGWRWHNGAGDALLAIGLLLLLRFALLWVSILLGVVLGSPEMLMAIQILVWPLGFLSNTYVEPSTMPRWLGYAAEWNPLSATVSATRELFGNPGWGGESWIANHGVLMAVAWPLLIAAICFPLAIRAYRNLDR
jgi:ABC transporter DrrB family efflux protein